MTKFAFNLGARLITAFQRTAPTLRPRSLQRMCPLQLGSLATAAFLLGETTARAAMTGKNIIRADLADAVSQKVGLSRAESSELVEQVLREICDTLAKGEGVKLSGFGVFAVRHKGERVGRNPKTGVVVPIEPRQSITFSASPMLKAHVNGASSPPSSICSLARRPRVKRPK